MLNKFKFTHINYGTPQFQICVCCHKINRPHTERCNIQEEAIFEDVDIDFRKEKKDKIKLI